MLSLYLLCGIVGLGWTVVNFALGAAAQDLPGGELHVGGAFGGGGHGDATTGGTGHVGPLDLPLFSPTAIAGYLTGFGATGYGLVGGLGIDEPLVHVPAALFGAAVLGFGVAWGTVRLLQIGETDSAAYRAALVGRKGELTVGIPDGGVGEVAYLAGGTRSTAPARTADGGPLPRGTAVRIVRADDTTFVVRAVPQDESDLSTRY